MSSFKIQVSVPEFGCDKYINRTWRKLAAEDFNDSGKTKSLASLVGKQDHSRERF